MPGGYPGGGPGYPGEQPGYQAQQHDGPADPNRPDHLWEPVEGDFGAHGSFDQRAHHRSWALKLTQQRSWLAAVAMILGSFIGAFLVNGRRDGGH